MKQIYYANVGDTYDVKRFDSSALNYVGRRWVVVRQSSIYFGRVYVNEVGGDGHRVTPRGYRKIESSFGQFPVGTRFVVVAKSPVSGSADCIRIRIESGSTDKGGCPDAAKSPCGCNETTSQPVAKQSGTLYIGGKAFNVVEK